MLLPGQHTVFEFTGNTGVNRIPHLIFNESRTLKYSKNYLVNQICFLSSGSGNYGTEVPKNSLEQPFAVEITA